MNFSDLLYKGKPGMLLPKVTGLPAGTSAYLFMAVPREYAMPSTRRTDTRPIHISRAAAVLFDEILIGKVNALSSDNARTYVEINESGAASPKVAYFDGMSTVWLKDAHLQTSLAAIMVGFLSSSHSEFAESRLAFQKVVQEYRDTDAITIQSLSYFCDCFYMDWKAYGISDIDEGSMDKVRFQEVEASVRTGTLDLVPDDINIKDAASVPLFGHTFSLITYDPPKGGKADVAKKKKTMDFFEQAKTCAFEIPYDWGENADKIVGLDFLDEYIPSSSFELATKYIFSQLSQVLPRMEISSGKDAIKKNYVNLKMYGKPGTGKTTTAEALSATLGLPIYICRFSKHTEEDEMEGKTKASENGFVFWETPFLEGYQNGGIIVLEDFNLADPAVLQGTMGDAIEAPFVLLKDGVTPVHRHPLCVIVATMNIGTEGTREQNQAFTSRFPLSLEIEDPDEDRFVEVLQVASGRGAKECKKIYRAYRDILNYIGENLHDDSLALCVTVRHCIQALKLLDLCTAKEAIYFTMIGALKSVDPVLGQEVYDNVIVPKPY